MGFFSKSKHFVDINRKLKRTVFLVGDGRSGTTWLADLINSSNEFRYMFEPCHPYFVDSVKDFDLYQYIRPFEDQDCLFYRFRNILSGKLRGPRIDEFNRRVFIKKRLIKDIFSHLYLKWINVHFPEVKLILLLRHPCAVAASKRELQDWQWLRDPARFIEQEALVNDFLSPFVDFIISKRSFFEKQVMIWCILHYVVLKQFNRNQLLPVFYESLCVDPHKEFRRLASFLGPELAPKIPQHKFLKKVKKASHVARSGSAILTGESLIHKWKQLVNQREINNAMEILEAFGLNEIYSEEGMPNTDDAESFFKTQ